MKKLFIGISLLSTFIASASANCENLDKSVFTRDAKFYVPTLSGEVTVKLDTMWNYFSGTEVEKASFTCDFENGLVNIKSSKRGLGWLTVNGSKNQIKTITFDEESNIMNFSLERKSSYYGFDIETNELLYVGGSIEAASIRYWK